MLGRGTRKGEHFPDKSHFVVFDCFDGTLLEYFRQATAMTAEPLQPEYKTITQIIEEIWQNRDRDYNIRVLVKRLQCINKEMAGEAREMFAAYVPEDDRGNAPTNFSPTPPMMPRRRFANRCGSAASVRESAAATPSTAAAWGSTGGWSRRALPGCSNTAASASVMKSVTTSTMRSSSLAAFSFPGTASWSFVRGPIDVHVTKGKPRGGESTKHEIRNPKQIRSTNVQNPNS